MVPEISPAAPAGQERQEQKPHPEDQGRSGTNGDEQPRFGDPIIRSYDICGRQGLAAATPASATVWSSLPEPPLTPMAPTTCPPRLIGIPPA